MSAAMGEGNYSVYVPSRNTPIELPNHLTIEEVKVALGNMGYTEVENAEAVQSGNEIRFRRVTGGTKG